jgi:hypothetical protein
VCQFLQRWGAICIGLMFGTWVVTLHLPTVLGPYGIPGAPNHPNEWSSLFIAVGLWEARGRSLRIGELKAQKTIPRPKAAMRELA